MNAVIKPAMYEDIEELLKLMAEFYAESGYRLRWELMRRALEELIQEPSWGYIWLLLNGDQAAGYIVLTIGFSMEYGGRDAFLDDLFIRPEFRGQGLGRLAMETLLDDCRRRGIRAVHVEVGRDNTPAKELYARYGFRETDRQLLTCRLSEETSVEEA